MRESIGLLLLTVLVAAVLLIARTPNTAESTPENASVEPTLSPVPTSPAAPTPTPPPAPAQVAFTGDIHAEPPIRGVLDGGGNPLADAAPVLRAADLAVANVETAVGSLGRPQDKSYTFQAPVSLWPALVDAGIDVVSLANNHALDFGTDALLETLDGARAAGLHVIGAGRDAAEAYAPAIIDVGTTTVAVVGLTRVMPRIEWAATPDRPGLASAYDADAAAAAVRAAAARADRVLVVIHWGSELAPCPVDHQQQLGALLTAAGADVVVGHHPHVLQGIAGTDDSVVAYSLGNFVFYARSEEARETGVLTVTLPPDGPPRTAFAPARIDDTGAPQLLTGADADAVRARVDALAPGAGICPA